MIKTWKERMPNGVAGHIGMSHETLCMHEEITELRTALEAAQKDAERIAFLRWSKEIVIAKLDDCGVWRKSSIPTLDAAIKAQGAKP